MPSISLPPEHFPFFKTSRGIHSAPGPHSESTRFGSSPGSFHEHRLMTAHPAVTSTISPNISSDHVAVPLPNRRAASKTPSPTLIAPLALPSAKALGKRKRREADARDNEKSGSPSKMSRSSAWRKHAGRYVLTPVLGPARELDETPTAPVGISDYDASSEGSSQRSSVSPPPKATESPSVLAMASRSGPFKFVGRRPPVCSPAASYTNLSYRPFSPDTPPPEPLKTRIPRRHPRQSISPRASTSIFSPRTRRLSYVPLALTGSPQSLPEPGTRVTVLPALSVRVRNIDLPLGALPSTPSGRPRLFGTASPVSRLPRRSRILPAGTAEPCSSLGSGTIIFFNEINEIRAYRVAPDIHSYAEKLVRTRPMPPSPGNYTPILQLKQLPHEPVRCITPEPAPCATPEPLDIFPERYSPHPSVSGDSAVTLCTYSPQLSTSITLVNDSDDATF
ncbi:unnamed protein product [Peniophora sp. CBMAI 1063]|nr:unnamed protein product [Peniophora sp. CBMAI 1063]